MMNQKTYMLIAGILFSLIAVGHLLRIAFGWSAVLDQRIVPMWPSWLALVIAGLLGFEGLRLSRKG